MDTQQYNSIYKNMHGGSKPKFTLMVPSKEGGEMRTEGIFNFSQLICMACVCVHLKQYGKCSDLIVS